MTEEGGGGLPRGQVGGYPRRTTGVALGTTAPPPSCATSMWLTVCAPAKLHFQLAVGRHHGGEGAAGTIGGGYIDRGVGGVCPVARSA